VVVASNQGCVEENKGECNWQKKYKETSKKFVCAHLATLCAHLATFKFCVCAFGDTWFFTYPTSHFGARK
jgi:hypothetical protein